VGFPINVVFIHLMQTENGRSLFSNSKFNKALKKYLNAYGKMLTTKTSLTYMNDQTYGWFSPKAINDSVDYALFKCDPSKPHTGSSLGTSGS
jgi:phosphatidylserine decarboxylase